MRRMKPSKPKRSSERNRVFWADQNFVRRHRIVYPEPSRFITMLTAYKITTIIGFIAFLYLHGYRERRGCCSEAHCSHMTVLCGITFTGEGNAFELYYEGKKAAWGNMLTDDMNCLREILDLRVRYRDYL